MRIVHISDLHLTSLRDRSFADLLGKRWTGYASWRYKRRWQHRREVLDNLTQALRAERADRIVITGDLTHIGLPEEIVAARDWLRSLAPPEHVLLIPGNHDIYARDSWPAIRRHWADYLHWNDVRPDARRHDGYPVVRERDGVALIGLNSALQTPMLLARGKLGTAQCERLDALLAALHARGVLCCLLIHHPPLPGHAPWRKALADAAALERIIARHAPALVLHGHMHRNTHARVGPTRVYATASGSSSMPEHPAAYRVFEISRNAQGGHLAMHLTQATADASGFARVQSEVWQYEHTPVGSANHAKDLRP